MRSMPPRGAIPRKKSNKRSPTFLQQLDQAVRDVAKEIPGQLEELEEFKVQIKEVKVQKGIIGALENLLGEAGLPGVIDALLRRQDDES